MKKIWIKFPSLWMNFGWGCWSLYFLWKFEDIFQLTTPHSILLSWIHIIFSVCFTSFRQLEQSRSEGCQFEARQSQICQLVRKQFVLRGSRKCQCTYIHSNADWNSLIRLAAAICKVGKHQLFACQTRERRFERGQLQRRQLRGCNRTRWQIHREVESQSDRSSKSIRRLYFILIAIRHVDNFFGFAKLPRIVGYRPGILHSIFLFGPSLFHSNFFEKREWHQSIQAEFQWISIDFLLQPVEIPQ